MPRPAPPHLTRREAQIMEILHRRRRATVEEVRAELPDAPSPSSVRKLLDIMIGRRLLAREYEGLLLFDERDHTAASECGVSLTHEGEVAAHARAARIQRPGESFVARA